MYFIRSFWLRTAALLKAQFRFITIMFFLFLVLFWPSLCELVNQVVSAMLLLLTETILKTKKNKKMGQSIDKRIS